MDAFTVIIDLPDQGVCYDHITANGLDEAKQKCLDKNKEFLYDCEDEHDPIIAIVKGHHKVYPHRTYFRSR